MNDIHFYIFKKLCINFDKFTHILDMKYDSNNKEFFICNIKALWNVIMVLLFSLILLFICTVHMCVCVGYILYKSCVMVKRKLYNSKSKTKTKTNIDCIQTI